LHVFFRKYKQRFDVSVTTHLVYAIADISIEGQNRLVGVGNKSFVMNEIVRIGTLELF
jgi:hypothetical protein